MVVEKKPPYIGGKYFLLLELQTAEGTTGIGERIAGMAKAHCAMIAPHRYCGPVAAAAAMPRPTGSAVHLWGLERE